MSLNSAFATIGKLLRKLDDAVSDVETLIEQKLHERTTGKPSSARPTRGDWRSTSSDRRQKTK